MLRAVRERILKAAIATALLALALAPLPAAADELVVGVVRDQDGAVVAGAPVTALDARGGALGRDRTAADGTFAIAAAQRPAALLIAPADAESLRLPLAVGEQPVAAIVRRHRAADAVPSVADVAALPAGSLAALADAVPYRIASPNAISERYLARGQGVVLIEGVPFYRRSDGADATGLLPAHAAGALTVRDPLEAPWYGDRAGGGVLDAGLFDRLDGARATDRDAALAPRAGSRALGFAAGDWEPDGRRELVAARATARVADADAAFLALAGTAPAARYAALAAELRRATQRVDLRARLDLSGDDGGLGAEDAAGRVDGLTLDAAGRGPGALALRARWRDEHGTIAGQADDHRDAALVLGTSRGSVVRLRAALALAYGRESGYEAPGSSATALLPSLGLEAPLGARWSARAGATASTLGTPGMALARASLVQAALAYADHRRLRAELLAYAERDAAPTARTRGLAASLGWELAPRLSLRAWAVRDGDQLDVTAAAYPGGPAYGQTQASTLRRELTWLTWDGPVRLDLLVRAGALEGGLRVPLGARSTLVLGSARTANGNRTFTAGLSGR